jgi:hypothetical protein
LLGEDQLDVPARRDLYAINTACALGGLHGLCEIAFSPLSGTARDVFESAGTGHDRCSFTTYTLLKPRAVPSIPPLWAEASWIGLAGINDITT